MSLLPLFKDLYSFFMLTETRLAEVIPKVERLDSGGCAGHGSDGPVGRLSQQRHVSDALLRYLFANVVGHLLHVTRLQKLLCVEHREGALFRSDLCRRVVSLSGNEPIE